jgi:hypothetical protein
VQKGFLTLGRVNFLESEATVSGQAVRLRGKKFSAFDENCDLRFPPSARRAAGVERLLVIERR